MANSLLKDDLPQYTYDDYKNWEDRWELIHGIAYAMSPSPKITHQHISNNIARYLAEALQHCSKCRALLPVDWKIDDFTIVQPDNCVVCFESEQDEYLSQAPAIVFEILSPSTAKKDKGIKFRLYETHGVAWYIIVDADTKTAEVYQLEGKKYHKVCDAKNETVTFTLADCDKPLEFDFSKIW